MLIAIDMDSSSIRPWTQVGLLPQIPGESVGSNYLRTPRTLPKINNFTHSRNYFCFPVIIYFMWLNEILLEDFIEAHEMTGKQICSQGKKKKNSPVEIIFAFLSFLYSTQPVISKL